MMVSNGTPSRFSAVVHAWNDDSAPSADNTSTFRSTRSPGWAARALGSRLPAEVIDATTKHSTANASERRRRPPACCMARPRGLAVERVFMVPPLLRKNNQLCRVRTSGCREARSCRQELSEIAAQLDLAAAAVGAVLGGATWRVVAASCVDRGVAAASSSRPRSRWRIAPRPAGRSGAMGRRVLIPRRSPEPRTAVHSCAARRTPVLGSVGP